MTKKTDLAWAAGIFEGEGCFSGQFDSRRSIYYPRASVSMTDFDVVDRFARIVGFGALSTKPGRTRKTATRPYKPQRHWFSSDVKRLYRLIGPWLGRRRTARVREVLALARKYRSRPKTHCVAGHPFSKSNTWMRRQKGRTNLVRVCRTCARSRWVKCYGSAV